MSLTLSMMEFMLLLFGAIVVGITIHLFFTSRNGRKATTREMGTTQAMDEWKLKYLSDMEMRDKEVAGLQQQLRESEEKVIAFSKKAEELRQYNNEFELIIEKLEKKVEEMEKETDNAMPAPASVIPMPNKADYLDQVLLAQSRLMEQNEKINHLLGSLENIREKEEKQRQILRDNAELASQLNKMKGELTDKEKEIDTMKQKEHLTKDMVSMLDVAHSEFNALQVTIQHLESKLTSSKMTSFEYEDIREEYSRLIKEVEEYRKKTISLTNENQQLQLELTAVRDKYKESDFYRQQLQKRINYLTELNADLQLVADANKKLESQLKQIGNLESMLNTLAEDRPGYTPRKGEA